jgi:ceramide glucosyltransferase
LVAETIIAATGVACLGVAAAGSIYALGAALVVRRIAGGSGPPPSIFPDVTILKPLAGSTPGLYEDLASFCDQDYPGAVQILFGVQDSADAAVEIVQRLIAERPGRDLELVSEGHPLYPNPKIANLVALEPRIRHEVVVLADADIAVARGHLRETMAALAQPGVGAVTCLYRGVARGGLWARLASMGIDYDFFPSVLISLRLGLAQPCFGSTIALRRETLAAIGGFRAFANHIADDYAIGAAVRATGLKVAIPPLIVAHACSEQSAVELLRHELRWARTLRALAPLGYAGTIVTHPLPLALLGAALTGFDALGVASIALAVACRLVLQLQVDHTLHVTFKRWRLGPARDLVAFGIYLASYFVDVVTWRGQRYRVRSDGTLIRIGKHQA